MSQLTTLGEIARMIIQTESMLTRLVNIRDRALMHKLQEEKVQELMATMQQDLHAIQDQLAAITKKAKEGSTKTD